jgi:hypothetical protein
MSDYTSEEVTLTETEWDAIREANSYGGGYILHGAIAKIIAARVAEAKAEAWDEAVATVRLYPGGMGLSCGPNPYREPRFRNEQGER